METTTVNYENQGKPPMPKTWLVESILVTILCCLVAGIVGIIFSSQVQTKYNAGDFEGALNSSKQAGMWTKIGFFIGIAFVVIYLIIVAIWGAAFFTMFSNAEKFSNY